MAKDIEVEERLERAEIFMLKVSEFILFGVTDSSTLDYFYDIKSELETELEEVE